MFIEVSIPRWINSADGILDMTVGSLLPVAPSTRLVASTYQRRTIHDTSQVAAGRNRSRPFHVDLCNTTVGGFRWAE